jgi:hypothetical protein
MEINGQILLRVHQLLHLKKMMNDEIIVKHKSELFKKMIWRKMVKLKIEKAIF